MVIKLFTFIYIMQIYIHCDGYYNWRYNDTTLNMPKFEHLVGKFGHKVEEYKVITDDSYVLKLFRIPGSMAIPTLLVHGFLDSSSTWVIRDKNSLGFSLARRGYDLWFANCRGNYHSREHLFLDPNKDDAFWDFSFHDIGVYDISAIIDTVLNETEARKLNYIGHSQGNMVLYALTSMRPEYNDKVNVAIALAPVSYFHNARLPVSLLVRNFPFYYRLAKLFNLHEFMGYKSRFMRNLRTICNSADYGYDLCVYGMLFTVCGIDADELESDFYFKLLRYFPAGASSKALEHFEQIGSSKTFMNYDYGLMQNLRVYNSCTPPVYNFTNVRIPTYLIVGKNDILATVADVNLLSTRLPNVIEYIVLPKEDMNHIDFVWGRNAKEYLFPYIFRALESFN